MSVLASAIMDESRQVFLNDAGSKLYTNTVLLPFLSRAFSELQQKLEVANAPQLIEISAPITVTTGDTVLLLPNDFVFPIKLEERTAGSSDDYVPMTKTYLDIPATTGNITLGYWTFREDEIKVRPANIDVEVKLTYYKLLTIIGENTSITIPRSINFLSARTAALAAKYIGQNLALSHEIMVDAADSFQDLKTATVKTSQSEPVRRMPFMWRFKNVSSSYR